MNTTNNAVKLSNREFYLQRADATLHRIPGAWEILTATASQRPILEAKYPDAAFAVNILSNPFIHDRELGRIRMDSFTAILSGEKLADVHRRHDREVETYLSEHNWD